MLTTDLDAIFNEAPAAGEPAEGPSTVATPAAGGAAEPSPRPPSQHLDPAAADDPFGGTSLSTDDRFDSLLPATTPSRERRPQPPHVTAAARVGGAADAATRGCGFVRVNVTSNLRDQKTLGMSSKTYFVINVDVPAEVHYAAPVVPAGVAATGGTAQNLVSPHLRAIHYELSDPVEWRANRVKASQEADLDVARAVESFASELLVNAYGSSASAAPAGSGSAAVPSVSTVVTALAGDAAVGLAGATPAILPPLHNGMTAMATTMKESTELFVSAMRLQYMEPLSPAWDDALHAARALSRGIRAAFEGRYLQGYDKRMRMCAGRIVAPYVECVRVTAAKAAVGQNALEQYVSELPTEFIDWVTARQKREEDTASKGIDEAAAATGGATAPPARALAVLMDSMGGLLHELVHTSEVIEIA
eukprot:gene282-155_t